MKNGLLGLLLLSGSSYATQQLTPFQQFAMNNVLLVAQVITEPDVKTDKKQKKAAKKYLVDSQKNNHNTIHSKNNSNNRFGKKSAKYHRN